MSQPKYHEYRGETLYVRKWSTMVKEYAMAVFEDPADKRKIRRWWLYLYMPRYCPPHFVDHSMTTEAKWNFYLELTGKLKREIETFEDFQALYDVWE